MVVLSHVNSLVIFLILSVILTSVLFLLELPQFSIKFWNKFSKK